MAEREARASLGRCCCCKINLTVADENSQREDLEIRTTAYDAFNHNIRMLNESMGTCIPSMTSRDPT